MQTMADMAIFTIRMLGTLYLLIILLRFLLQIVRADFYNPVSQGISKATNPLLLPLRRIIPGLFGLDIACLVLAIILQCIAGQIIVLLQGGGLLNPLFIFSMSIIGILKMLVDIYFWGMMIYIIASWVAPFSRNPALTLLRQLIEPVMAPLRKLIPPLGPIDITPIFFILGLRLLSLFVIPTLARSMGVPGVWLGF